jgi:hypothetical protein
MSQHDINAFVTAADSGMLTPKGVTSAILKGISMNARCDGRRTALHWAVIRKRSDLVTALVAAGADPNTRDDDGRTLVWWAAYNCTATILQLLINDCGASVNDADDYGDVPITTLLGCIGDADARLGVLLTCPDVDLETIPAKITSRQWRPQSVQTWLLAAITKKCNEKARWAGLRSAWVAALAPMKSVVQRG